MALDGLEEVLEKRFGQKHSRKAYKHKVNLVRYADDFVITGSSKQLLEDEVKPLVEAFLAKRGLALSAEKTRVVHIDEGFDFLGWNFRKYNGTLLIKPAKKSVKAFLRNVREEIKAARTAKQVDLILRLNPIIRGWSNYHRQAVAKDTFSRVDHEIWKALWRWACRRHPHKPVRWVRKRYFLTLGNRNWVFGATVKDDRGGQVVKKLLKAQDTPIRKPLHIKIKGDANPFDPRWEAYFAKRLSFEINTKWVTGGGRVSLSKFHRKCHRQVLRQDNLLAAGLREEAM
jgi:RNA-directed DNA polymerase